MEEKLEQDKDDDGQKDTGQPEVEVNSAQDWKELSAKVQSGEIDTGSMETDEIEEDEDRGTAVATRPYREFEPTTTKQLNIICWQTKPWKDKKPSRLFSSQFAVAWKVDCDEVYPGKKFKNRFVRQFD